MKMVMTMAAVFLILALAGCGIGHTVRPTLEADLTKDMVVTMLGQPDKYLNEGGYESLIYRDQYVPRWVNHRTDYVFVFRDGKVVVAVADSRRGGLWNIVLLPR